MIAMTPLACVNPEHKDEVASYLCKEEECIENNPICTLCAFSSHKDHAVEPLKMIMHKIELDAASFKENLVSFAQIDVLREKIYVTCEGIAEVDARKTVKSAIDHYLTILLAKTEYEEMKDLHKLANGSSPQSSKLFINSLIKYQKKCLSQNFESQKSTKESNYTKLLKRIIEELQDLATTFQQIVKKGDADHSTSELFVVENVGKRFKFSSKYKHSKFQLNEDNIVKMPDQYVNYNYYILLEPKLSITKVQSVILHMVNLTSYVTVGICNLDKISKNYEFNTGETSHGSYQLSFDGYSWGDNNSSINSQYTGWYFNQGDKVTLEFNPKTKKLKFYKNLNPELNYEMPIEFEKKDKLYFCVTLNSSPEEVHIVSG